MVKSQSPSRWRFSIRTSIVCLTMFGVAFAIVGEHVRRLRAQERAFAEISEHGGTIFVYDEGVSIIFRPPNSICGTGLNRIIGPTGSPQQFSDEETRYLHSVIDLMSVDLRNTSVTDQGIEQLQREMPRCQIDR